MSVNLKKHHDSMVKAWKDVLDDKTPTDWALFGYEGPSNDLRLVGFGNGGLEELADELNSSQIMYAFLRVSDPQTSLHKCILINWQGEGAPVVRKGTCANHIRDVERLFHGAHATLNARTEEDVEEARVMKIISTGSRYDFKGPRGADEQRGPIGSTYQRVVPGREINTAERDIFWQKEEQEEKARTAAEAKRKQEENIKLENERIKREQLAAQLREKQVKEREAAITEAQKMEKIRVVQIPQGEQDITPSPPSVTADELRRQRNQEARELIGQRSIASSRALFEGGVQFNNKSNLAPVKPVRNSVTQRINVLTQQSNSSSNLEVKNGEENNKIEKHDKSENNNKHAVGVEPKVEQIVTTADNNLLQQNITEKNIAVPEIKSETQNNCADVDLNNYNEDTNYMVENSDFDLEQNGEQFSTIKRSPHSKSIESNLAQNAESVSKTTNLGEVEKLSFADETEQNDDYSIYQDMTEPGLQARALYDYQAADESEITFDPGDLITHIDCIDEGWWQGLGPDGTFGLFPANYVELLQ